MAGSAIIGTLRAILQLDTAEFESASARMSDSAKTWSRDFKKIGQEATQLGTALTKTLTLPLVALGVGATKLAMDFESSFAGVGKTVDGVMEKSGELTAFGKELAQSFRNLAKEIPVNVNELNKIGEAAGALGIKKSDILGFTKVMAELGVTTNLTSDQAANAVARIQNIFGAAGKDTDRLASTLVALGNAGASTETEIVEMGQRIAGAGHAIGLTQAQVLAFASTLSSVGINAEAGGSAISRIFLKMNDAVMSGGDALNEFARVAGISADQFKEKFEKDAAGATVLFIEGLKRLKDSGENTNQTMEGMIGKNIILKDTLNRLTGSGKLLSDQLELGNTAWRENTALTEEAQKRFGTTEAQLTLLWNRVQDVGITIGNALLPMVRALVGFVGDLIPVIETAAKIFASLPTPIQVTAVGIAALVAAAGPAIYVFGQLALASAAVTASFAANGLASRFLLADLGFLLTGLRTAALAAAANVTAFGAMGAASIALTGAVRALWVAMAAHPLVALAAGIGAVTLALTKLYTASVDRKQEQLISGIKAETIARAEQAGVILKSADAHARYLEAVDALQKIETIRQSKFTGSLEQQKQAIVYELELGRITQETANTRLAALAGDEQAASVRSKHVSITELAKQAEKAFADEIKATGYSVGELQKLLKDDPQTFAAFAKQVGLSSEAVARLKGELKESKAAIKDNAAEMKKAEQEAEDFKASLKALSDAAKSLGVVTEQDVNEQLARLQLGLAGALSGGVSLKNALPGMIDKLSALAVEAKKSGLDVSKLTDMIKGLRAILGTPLLPRELFREGLEGLDLTKIGFKDVSLSAGKARTDAQLLGDAFDLLGIKTTASLKAQAAAARQAYADIAASGTATKEQLIAARQAVLDAEIAAGERTAGVWEGTIKPAIEGVIKGLSGSLARGLTDMIGHWNRAGDIMKDIWQGVKNTFLNVLEEMLSNFINGFLKGLIEGIASAALGQRLANSLLGGGAGGGIIGLGGATTLGPAPGVGGSSGAGGGLFPGAGAVGQAGTTIGIFEAIFKYGFNTDKGLIDGIFDPLWTPELTADEQRQAILDYFGPNSTQYQDFLNALPVSGLTGIMPDAGDSIPNFNQGTFGQYVDFGAGTLARLHGREKITPEGAEVDPWAWGSKPPDVVLNMNGREWYRITLPDLIDVLRDGQLTRA